MFGIRVGMLTRVGILVAAVRVGVGYEEDPVRLGHLGSPRESSPEGAYE